MVYLIITPALGNAAYVFSLDQSFRQEIYFEVDWLCRNNIYFVKFGDIKGGGAATEEERVKQYDTYNPQNNRVSIINATVPLVQGDVKVVDVCQAALICSDLIMLLISEQGTTLTNQVFKATNPFLQRPAFTQQGGTEFFQVRSVNQNNQNGLQALVNG